MREYSYIVGDVGFNYTHLQYYRVEDGIEKQPVEGIYNSQNFKGLHTVLEIFITENFIDPAPDYGVFSINGPVTNGRANMPLLGWQETAQMLETETGIKKVRLMNNYEAKGYGIGYLEQDDVYELHKGTEVEGGPRVVIGAESGLGQAFVFTVNGEKRVLAGEGGHSAFAPKNKEEFELAQFIKKKFDLTDLSQERVISGIGLNSIYWYLVSTNPDLENPDLSEKILAEESPGRVVMSYAIGTTVKDTLCSRAVSLFLGAYGATAGNFALAILATGGVYVAGEMARMLHDRMRTEFLDNFFDKGRMRRLLAQFPIRVILNNKAALLGARHVARTLLSDANKPKNSIRSIKTIKFSRAKNITSADNSNQNESYVRMPKGLGWVAAGAALSFAVVGAFALGAASR